MNALIEINNSVIGEDQVQTVNARDLHEFLEVGKMFAHWIKDRIEKYRFEHDKDYVCTIAKTGIRSNVLQKDYFITLDMAKELSMVERNEKGRQIRKYFIDCERQLHSKPKEKLTIVPAAEEFKAAFSIASLLGLDKNASAISANTVTKALTGVDCLSLMGNPVLLTEDQELIFTPTELGEDLGISGQAVNKRLEEAGLQTKANGSWIPTGEGVDYARVIDSSKRHSDGSMIQQVKWNRKVLPLIS